MLSSASGQRGNGALFGDNVALGVAIGSGLAKYFQLPLRDVDDPVLRDARLAVTEAFDRPVAVQSGVGDFDGKSDV